MEVLPWRKTPDFAWGAWSRTVDRATSAQRASSPRLWRVIPIIRECYANTTAISSQCSETRFLFFLHLKKMTAIVSVQNSFNSFQKHDIPHPAVSYLVGGICRDKSTSQFKSFFFGLQFCYDDVSTCSAPGNQVFCHPCNQARSGLDDFSSSSCFFGEQKLSSDVDGSSSSFLKFKHRVAPSPSLQLVR